MRGELPSLTACVVAWARAAASRSRVSALDPKDTVTAQLLPMPFSVAVDLVAQVALIDPRFARLVFRASFGLFDHVVLRTVAIDDALTHAVANGIDQLVILGAGLDARAHRLKVLRDTVVFEVDHPASQRFKRRKATTVPVQARELRYVAVDFERDDLVERLRASGFDSSKRSVWIWEGVVPYLKLPAIEATLRAVHGLSAPGSELLVTYITNESTWVRRRRMVTKSALVLLGEPLHTHLSPQEAARLITAAGFELVSDTHTADWHARYANDPETPSAPSLEHLIHVRRQ